MPNPSNFKFVAFNNQVPVDLSSISSPVQTVSAVTDWSSASLDYDDVKSISNASEISAAIKTDGTLWLWGTAEDARLGNNDTINQSSPVQTVCTGNNWKQVSLGGRHSAAIKTDGTLWLWGFGAGGQLGIGTQFIGNCNRSTPVQTSCSGTNWKQVSLGRVHSAAIKTDGTLWTWGCNDQGQLGATFDVSLQVRTNPNQTISFTNNWKQVSAGDSHTAAIKTDGTLWLWGESFYGQLGNNSIIDRSSPVQTVSTGNNWKQVSLGTVHSAAIKADGTLWTWGFGCCGSLGNNSTTDRSSPVQTIATGTNWRVVSAGNIFTSALKTDGTLWSWGINTTGALGDNSVTSRSSPVQTVSTGTNWEQVAIGLGNHTLANKTDGTLWLWGTGSCGRLGTNTNTNQSSPVQTVSATTTWLLDESLLVAAGGNHSAAIKNDGTLWLWGCNVCGRLGNNSTINQSSPVQTVATGTDWKQVALGFLSHSAAIKTDGTLWLWGNGDNGRLGTNATTSHSSPVQTVSTGTNWKQVSLGGAHSAAIKTDGTLWLWGINNLGHLGNNSTSGPVLSPVQTVCTGTNWRQVSLGCNHSAAIKTDGTLWVWGDNANGKLGTGIGVLGLPISTCPRQTSGQGTNWKQVSLGGAHSAAIKTDGTLWLWGDSANGELGTLNADRESSPTQTVSQTTNWKQVSLGEFHSAAVKTDGTLWLWGSNQCGKLGNNSTTPNQSSPVQTVSTGTSWTRVSLGTDHTLVANNSGRILGFGINDAGQLGCDIIRFDGLLVCADFDDVFVRREIFSQGGLWGWGVNDEGQLGNNTTTFYSSPVQTVSGGSNWKQVSLGADADSYSAAIKTDGTLWLWGGGTCGQLGNNNTLDVSSPVQTVSSGNNWRQVSVGCIHSSAIKTDGTLWLWGEGAAGRLGTNSTTDRSSPVQTVSTGTNWKQVSLGGGHSAAIKTDGTLWLWGCNLFGIGDSGQIGDNSTVSRSSPVQTVSTGTNWKQVSLGDYHSAAIKTDGTLWLWGLNSCGIAHDVRGQLGNNNTINQSSPVQTIACGTNWKQVNLGNCASAAIKTDGTLWLWGRNLGGSLGDLTGNSKSSPVQTVSTGTNWKQVDLGCHSAAVKTDGTLWLWGLGDFGRLGNNSTTDRSSPVQTVSTGTNWIDVSAGAFHSFGIREDCY